MRIGSHEYANEADDNNIPKLAQSLGTSVPRQKYQKAHVDTQSGFAPSMFYILPGNHYY